MVDKEGKSKENVVEEAITPLISQKKIETVNKTEISQTSNKIVDAPRRNKTDKVKK